MRKSNYIYCISNVCIIKHINIFLYYTASRREMARDTETVMAPKSSPKRFAVVSPKPQSPGESYMLICHTTVCVYVNTYCIHIQYIADMCMWFVLKWYKRSR